MYKANMGASKNNVNQPQSGLVSVRLLANHERKEYQFVNN